MMNVMCTIAISLKATPRYWIRRILFKTDTMHEEMMCKELRNSDTALTVSQCFARREVDDVVHRA